MKIYRTLLLAMFPLAALSCGKEEADPGGPMEEPVLVPHTVTAFAGEESAKTSLNPSDDGQVLWSPAEHVHVFVGDSSYEFTGTNAGEAASTTFTGTAPADLGTYVMLSPYNPLAAKSGWTVSTSLPAVQTGLAGSFDNGILVLSGKSSTTSVTCRHVCSGLRFKTGRNGVKAVVLQGNGGEKIAGDFSFSFSGDTPVAGAGSESSVTLTAPGGTFASDQWYYIVTLPGTFSGGITLTAYTDDAIGTLRIGTPVTFTRGIFKAVSSLDSRMSWEAPETRICYGPQNSFCARAGEDVAVDVSPRLIADNWQRSSLSAPVAAMPDECTVLWGSATASLSGNTLSMRSNAKGSSLVAVRKGGTILWSYLLWVTSSEPASIKYLPSGAELQEPLGGELYFQWGRKDPLRSNAIHEVPASGSRLAYSLTHPEAFIDPGEHNDWFSGDTSQNDNLWGGVSGTKTVWDPCPQGWKVPAWPVFNGLSRDDDRFTDLGYIAQDFWPSGLTYWTATPTPGDYFSCAFINEGGDEYDYEGDARFLATPIRCVKE